jgi:hypothetical protein
MKLPRLSETTTGRITPLKSRATETAIMLEPLVSTLGGGKCGETRMMASL